MNELFLQFAQFGFAGAVALLLLYGIQGILKNHAEERKDAVVLHREERKEWRAEDRADRDIIVKSLKEEKDAMIEALRSIEYSIRDKYDKK